MGAETVTQRRFICDHANCRMAGVYDNDAKAAVAGWARVDINLREYWVCDEHRAIIEYPLREGKHV